MTDHPALEGLDRLCDVVCCTGHSPRADDHETLRAVYTLLADGEPVTTDVLAATLGWRPARSKEALERLPDAEFDDDLQAVVGVGGLTLRPTPHQITVHGQVRYAWCAWDTLFLPIMLATPIDVTSRCPQTGQPVTLTVTPTGITRRRPAATVMSFLEPDAVDPSNLRASFCGEVHFLADAAAAADWKAATPTRLVLDPDDAFELGRRIARRCGP